MKVKEYPSTQALSGEIEKKIQWKSSYVFHSDFIYNIIYEADQDLE